jgi:hypothetical protein
MLLVGGGVGPPVIGVLAGVAGLGIDAPHTWSREHLSVDVRRVLAAAWPWVFGLTLINGVILFVGAIVLVYGFGWGNPDLFLNSFFFALISVIVTILAGVAYDVQRGERDAVVHA